MDQDVMPGAPLALRGRVITPEAVLEDAVVVLRDGVVDYVGPLVTSPVAPPPPSDLTLLPGLVDVHCHGGGGAGFPDVGSPDQARAAVGEHLRHGTTSLVASLVTASRDTLLARTATLAPLLASGELAGLHLEGPFLSPERCGAQDPALMTTGDPALVREVAEAAGGRLFSMTVAPEVPGVRGAGSVLDALAEVGALPSFGHTAATAPVVRAAVEEAAAALHANGPARRPTATHLFNGMPSIHHRDPGPALALLAAAARGQVVVELVADGVHLDPETVRAVADLVGRVDGLVLVTDAMAATGMPDGSYRLGSADVVVDAGVARLAADGAIAGGTAHLLDVVRHTVAAGVPLVTAVRAASLVPAGLLGLDDVGRLTVGARADVLVTDRELRPVRVLRAGVDVPTGAEEVGR